MSVPYLINGNSYKSNTRRIGWDSMMKNEQENLPDGAAIPSRNMFRLRNSEGEGMKEEKSGS